MDKNNEVYLKIHRPKRYEIDSDTIKSQEDLFVLLKTLLEHFNITVSEDFKEFDKIKKYLKEVE